MFGLDDWTMVAATIFAVLNVVLAGLGMPSVPYVTMPSLMP
jgi:hypothetical protein